MLNKEKYIYLSYSLGKHIPAYGKFQLPLPLEVRNCFSKGDSCTSYWVALENHWGTHIDAPAHFIKGAKKVSEYPADFWIFQSPQILTLELENETMIYPEKIKGKVFPETDILFLQTGFGKFRDQEKYCFHNPGVHSSVGNYLRENYPQLRVLGFDFISLSSFQNREEGRIAHQVFLNPEGKGNPILILEDVDLSSVSGSLEQVIITPLRIEEWDSSPCTVIGKLK